LKPTYKTFQFSAPFKVRPKMTCH